MKQNNSSKEFLIKNMDLIKERLNRRKGLRLMAEVDFSFKLAGKESVYLGRSINISSFGMSFSTGTVLYPDETLYFNFKLNTENMVIPGRIIRISGKEISVEFNLSQEERQRFVSLFNQEVTKDSSSIYISLMDSKKRIE